ncbi:hypothetical protein AB4Z48_35055 [Cupriavidus sp. 2TAF22]|uniref:hypothetical protein n=1 Tax=unclassified Cupriavidus TaxID=2640874 RepID=UPI003F8E5CDC
MANIEAACTGQAKRCEYRDHHSGQVDLGGLGSALNSLVSGEAIETRSEGRQAENGVTRAQRGNGMRHRTMTPSEGKALIAVTLAAGRMQGGNYCFPNKQPTSWSIKQLKK